MSVPTKRKPVDEGTGAQMKRGRQLAEGYCEECERGYPLVELYHCARCRMPACAECVTACSEGKHCTGYFCNVCHDTQERSVPLICNECLVGLAREYRNAGLCDKDKEELVCNPDTGPSGCDEIVIDQTPCSWCQRFRCRKHLDECAAGCGREVCSELRCHELCWRCEAYYCLPCVANGSSDGHMTDNGFMCQDCYAREYVD